MPKTPFYTKITMLFFAVAAFSGSALAQQGQMSVQDMRQMDLMAQDMEQTATLIALGVNVFFLILFGAILLIARRNMNGWNQPIKEVWFAFSGRLNRKAYWLKGVLLLSMIGTGVQLFSMMLTMVLGTGLGGLIGGVGLIVVLLPLLVFNIWAGLAITVKRLHDLGRSGWWILGFVIPLYNIWLAIKLYFFRGTPGPNAFGPDPIDEVTAYINEMRGHDDNGSDDGGDEAIAPVHPQPRPPEDGPQVAKGFGSKKFTKPVAPSTAPVAPEPEYKPAQMSGGSANIDVIKRRLGDDILRPIKRKGGGGRDAEG